MNTLFEYTDRLKKPYECFIYDLNKKEVPKHLFYNLIPLSRLLLYGFTICLAVFSVNALSKWIIYISSSLDIVLLRKL